MRSKILILIVALALAGVAAVLAVGYLNSARTSIALRVATASSKLTFILS